MSGEDALSLSQRDGVTVQGRGQDRWKRREVCVTRGLVWSDVRPGEESLELRDKVAGRKINFSSRVRSRARSKRSQLGWVRLMERAWK